MKKLIALAFMLAIFFTADAQKSQLGSLKITSDLTIGNVKITGISTDSSGLYGSGLNLMTERAIRALIRVNLGSGGLADTNTMLIPYRHWLMGYLKAADITGKADKSTVLTIDGVAQDISTNRTFTITKTLQDVLNASPIATFNADNFSARFQLTNNNSGINAAAGALYFNNLGEMLQYYNGSSTNAYMPRGVYMRASGLNGFKMVVDGNGGHAPWRLTNNAAPTGAIPGYYNIWSDSLQHNNIPQAASWGTKKVLIWDNTGNGNFYWIAKDSLPAGSGGAGTWGSITGTLSSQTDLNTALGLKAPLSSPALTGNPTAPTQAAGDNSTKLSTTAYADRAAANAVHDSAMVVLSHRGNKITFNAAGDTVWIDDFVKVATTASGSTITPNCDTTNMYTVTALAAAATFAAPTGTPYDGQPLMVRIKDNGTARALTFNSIYRASTDFALPTTTVISKTMYLQFIYNSADSKWDAVGYTNGF